MFAKNKWILGLIVGSMTLSGIAILDELVIKGIFAASGAIAYFLVGSLLGTGLITSRADAGKMRMFLFIILLSVFISIYMLIINFFTWLFSIPLWIHFTVITISICLLVIQHIFNKKAEYQYIDNANKITIEPRRPCTDTPSHGQNYSSNVNATEPKTIYELLAENKDKESIYVTRIDDISPGLEYVQVNQKALKYPTLKGYLKMDKAGIFREIYDANKEIWKIYK